MQTCNSNDDVRVLMQYMWQYAYHTTPSWVAAILNAAGASISCRANTYFICFDFWCDSSCSWGLRRPPPYTNM